MRDEHLLYELIQYKLASNSPSAAHWEEIFELFCQPLRAIKPTSLNSSQLAHAIHEYELIIAHAVFSSSSALSNRSEKRLIDVLKHTYYKDTIFTPEHLGLFRQAVAENLSRSHISSNPKNKLLMRDAETLYNKLNKDKLQRYFKNIWVSSQDAEDYLQRFGDYDELSKRKYNKEFLYDILHPYSLKDITHPLVNKAHIFSSTQITTQGEAVTIPIVILVQVHKHTQAISLIYSRHIDQQKLAQCVRDDTRYTFVLRNAKL